MNGRSAALQALFAEEAGQRLDRMVTGLLALEATLTAGGAEAGSVADEVAALFRDAHTVKGSASMMRFPAVVRLAHVLEDVLAEVRSGARSASPALVTGLLRSVDALRGVVTAALAGREDSAAAEAAAAELTAGLPAAATPAPTPPPTPVQAASPAPAAVAAPGPVPAPRRSSEESLSVGVALLDELSRSVASAAAGALQVGRLLREHGVDPESSVEYRGLTTALHALQESTTRTRMVAVGSLSGRLHRVARDLATDLGTTVGWEVRGGDTEVDRSLLGELQEALLHLVRNAVGHGLEPAAERVAAGKDPVGRVRVHAMRLGSEVVVTVSDDGRGLDLDALRRAAGSSDGGAELAFRAGVSTAAAVTDHSGRGVGLDAVRVALDRVRGRVEVASSPGVGTEFRVVVPVSLSLVRCLLLRVGAQAFALPLAATVTTTDRSSLGPDGMLDVAGSAVPSLPLARVLHPDATGPGEVVVVVSGASGRHALVVDEVLGQREVVVTALPACLPRLPLYAGAAAGTDGEVLLVLDPTGLVSAALLLTGDRHAVAPVARCVLVVDDAAVVRETERAMLERAGYRVRTAVDGEDAWSVLSAGGVDLVLTDLEMPHLDGLGLVSRVRADPLLAALPVVLISSRGSAPDRARGLAAGADRYLDKGVLDETALLATVASLLARAGTAVGSPA